MGMALENFQGNRQGYRTDLVKLKNYYELVTKSKKQAKNNPLVNKDAEVTASKGLKNDNLLSIDQFLGVIFRIKMLKNKTIGVS